MYLRDGRPRVSDGERNGVIVRGKDGKAEALQPFPLIDTDTDDSCRAHCCRLLHLQPALAIFNTDNVIVNDAIMSRRTEQNIQQ